MNGYFDWLCSIVSGSRDYRRLLRQLYETEFIFEMGMDENRAVDGIDLRYRYSPDGRDVPNTNCSILEMMIALARRMDNIMYDSNFGNRTSQWFWEMVSSLGLGGFTDSRYDPKTVDDILGKFMMHEYEHDGRGGLFTIPNSPDDLSSVEIWYQMNWYLDTIA